jgi:hypothetical protein
MRDGWGLVAVASEKRPPLAPSHRAGCVRSCLSSGKKACTDSSERHSHCYKVLGGAVEVSAPLSARPLLFLRILTEARAWHRYSRGACPVEPTPKPAPTPAGFARLRRRGPPGTCKPNYAGALGPP